MGGFEVTPAEDDDAPEGDSDDHTGTVIDANLVQHRERIRQGMGKVLSSDSKGSVGETRDGSIEIVSADVDSQETEFMGDSRCYDSENEDYDTHDRAMTMALGTLMLRKAKQKALVDASYNRFAWNDPKDLPSWFLDDEIRHNKPQIPVPGALLDQVHYCVYSLLHYFTNRCAEIEVLTIHLIGVD
jgi:AdoMet-dependent rRNA methyltransferase SPB1